MISSKKPFDTILAKGNATPSIKNISDSRKARYLKKKNKLIY